MKQIAEHIVEHQDRILNQVLEGAVREGFAADASLLAPGCRKAVHDLCAMLCGVLEAQQAPPGLARGGADEQDDPLSEFAATQARRHQARGMGLSHFLAVFKLIRQGFCEHASESGLDRHARATGIIARCFDNMEIAIVTEWTGRESAALARAEQERTAELIRAVTWLFMEIGRREETEQRIQAALDEKNILLREIHHRVKNNLQIISSLLELRALRSEDDHVVQALADARNKVHAIALIHSLLYRSGEPACIDISHILDEMIPYLYNLYGVDRNAVKLEIRADRIPLEIGQAIPCALVINEILSNAFKHAFPEGFCPEPGGAKARIRIFIRHSGNLVVLEVADNGTGLPDSVDVLNTGTMGLKMINTLVSAQLKGRVEFARNHGTRITISFQPRDSVT